MPAGKEVLVNAEHARTRPIFPLGRLAPEKVPKNPLDCGSADVLRSLLMGSFQDEADPCLKAET